MHQTLEFPDLLRLIDERSTAFRAAVASAPRLDARVPTCPDWTLLDLAHHLGVGRRAWAATVTAGPTATSKSAPDASAAPEEPEALVDWLAASTQQLLDALRDAGPHRGCWTWWGQSQSQQNSGAVARHQLQEIAVHTYDAQLTAGAPQELPAEVALDGVEDFLSTCCATTAAWPHDPAVVDYHATEGRSWRLWLSADGARFARLPTSAAEAAEDDKATRDAAYVSARGRATELVLFLYGRELMSSLETSGDRRVFDLLIAWEPEV